MLARPGYTASARAVNDGDDDNEDDDDDDDKNDNVNDGDDGDNEEMLDISFSSGEQKFKFLLSITLLFGPNWTHVVRI